jgi:hypothetical protein
MDKITLYDNEGKKAAVQLPYDEFLHLSDLDQEAPLLRHRMKQISELLQMQASSGLEDYPMPAAHPHEPEQEDELPAILKSATQLTEEPVFATEPEPEPIPEVVQPKKTSKNEQVDQDIKLAEKGPTPSTAKEFAIPIPPMLLDFLTEQDPSQKAKRLIMACAQKLSGQCGKRITLSLHKPYICLWDFDEWKTFAFGEIIQGHLHLSIEKALLPEADDGDVWVPPSGLCKKPLVRLKVDAITDDLLTYLEQALTNLTKSAAIHI